MLKNAVNLNSIGPYVEKYLCLWTNLVETLELYSSLATLKTRSSTHYYARTEL